jgi:mRNA export factor
MSSQWPLLVTAHQDRYIHIWDLKKVMTGQFDPIDLIESPLKFATTSLTVFGDGKGFVVGSIEGRCSVNNYDLERIDRGKSGDFCFKCHRTEDQTKKQGECYTVNAFAFNKKYNTLISLGSDGHFYTWNKDLKSKYKSSKKFPSPMTAGDFSEDGSLIAYAVGYDWSMGAEALKQRKYETLLYIRTPDIPSEVYKAGVK